MKIAAWLQGLLKAGLVCVSGLLASVPAYGFVQEITAEFRPNPANPMVNIFKNTTPESGMCPWHIPERCKQLGIFSIRTPAIQFTSSAPIQANHSDPRKGAMFKAPTSWREVAVTNLDTGQSETVKVRIAGIGNKWIMQPPAYYIAWDKGFYFWMYPSPPCVSTGMGTGHQRLFLFAWILPVDAGICKVQAIDDIPGLVYDTFEFSYEMKTPNPLTMGAGRYVGTLNYTIGPGADFDFGDIMLPNDNSLTLNFTLDVDHHLLVEVPPGGNRIQLEPQGGWQAWLNTGRKPSRLFRDQTVNLWASSQFKMNLECGEPLGNTCGLRNAAGHQVPVEVAVTLPPGLTDAVGRPVNRLPLRLDGSGTERFQPSRYIDRKPSTLHFEVKADAVAQMLDQGGSTYNGTVTVVWDSEV